MPNARVIKNRIKTVKNTGKITKTMAMVSAAKAAKVVGRIKASRPYAKRLKSFLNGLGNSCENHPLFIDNPEAGKDLVILLTANRGLCGGFNANLVRLGKAEVEAGAEVWVYGKKGISALRYAGIDMGEQRTDLKDVPEFETAQALADELVDAYESGQYRSVRFAYSEFLSAGSQKPTVETILPMAKEAEAEGNEENQGFEPIYHPGKEQLLGDLIPRLLRVSVYRILLDNSASEHLARQMAMNSASDNAGEMVRHLTLTYNRARQAQITTEISEIVGGAEAL